MLGPPVFVPAPTGRSVRCWTEEITILVCYIVWCIAHPVFRLGFACFSLFLHENKTQETDNCYRVCTLLDSILGKEIKRGVWVDGGQKWNRTYHEHSLKPLMSHKDSLSSSSSALTFCFPVNEQILCITLAEAVYSVNVSFPAIHFIFSVRENFNESSRSNVGGKQQNNNEPKTNIRGKTRVWRCTYIYIHKHKKLKK